MHGDFFNIAHIETASRIYGPGTRFVIWLQGCTLACEGCWNHEMWSHKPRTLVHRDEIVNRVLNSSGLTGITLLGGEPLQQIENTVWLLKKLQGSELGRMLYTGYEWDEIHAMPEGCELLENLDIIVPGRFRKELRNTGIRWRGSENQSIHFLTPRYNTALFEEANEMEIDIDEWGGVTLKGYPDQKERVQWNLLVEVLGLNSEDIEL